MSFAHAGSHRSTRLLPLESGDVLTSTDRFRLHVLNAEHDTKLSEHVAFYWDQQRDCQSYQQQLLREVRSTRGPTRFVGFPQVPSAAAATTTGQRGDAEAPRRFPPSSSTANDNAAGHDTVRALSTFLEGSAPEGEDAEARWEPPRALAAWSWVRLVAPYERLLCPSLQFSALLSPAVGSTTPLLYGTQPPSSSFTSAASSSSFSTLSPAAAPCCTPAHWSSQTCRTLWTLHETAAAVSLPAQEVYLLCAGMLLYLDVVVSSGRVWVELEGLWGGDLEGAVTKEGTVTLPTNCIAKAEGEGEGEGKADAAVAAARAALTALLALKATLSQPPQTYASLLQHVRVLLEALVFVSPTTSTAVNARPSPSSSAENPEKRVAPQPLLPWLTAAMEAEEWTATASISSSASTSRGETMKHTSDIALVMKVAVREWLARRGTTVTAAAPTGSRAVSLPMRDLSAVSESGKSARSRVESSGVGGRGRANASTITLSVATRDEGGGGAAAAATSAGAQRAAAAVPNGEASCDVASSSAGGGAPLAFDAFEPHDTPRSRHLFFLPPLPQDPAFLVFTVVWRRTLRRCVLDRDVARQQLRQVILGQAGQRCEELVREVRQQQEQQQQQQASTGELTEKVDAAQAAATSQPLLLTGDPAATSFRVLGPRSGEWVTARSGAWSGFRGELYRCVGRAPSPPTFELSHHGTPANGAAPATKARGRVASNTAPSGTPKVTEPLLERFVDGALELGSRARSGGGTGSSSSSGHPRQASSSSSSLAAASAVGDGAPLSTEELADRLCRLGAALPRYATEITGDRLRPVDAEYVREVLQQRCLPLFLACKRRGIQQWSLRGWLKGVALTLLDNSGMESRVATPAKLVEMGRKQLTAAVGGADVVDTAAALRMVMEGGLSEVAAFLEHVQKRRERLLRWLPARKVAPALTSSSVPPSVTSGMTIVSLAVEALLLRRAEESAIFSIFQCHPHAVALTGCGVQRLALHANPHRTRSSMLLVRTCGVVVEWDVQDCYEAPRHRRLRAPKRLTSRSRKALESDVSDDEDAPPLEIASALERLTLRHVRGMLHYYRRALITSTHAATTATAEVAASVGHVENNESLSFGMKRRRDEKDATVEGQRQEPPRSDATAFTAITTGGAKTPLETVRKEVSLTPEKTRDDAAVKDEKPPLSTTASAAATATGATGSVALPVSSPPLLSESTGLYPIDKTVALYVLRHHPHYFTEVVGCGIKDVLVAVKSTTATAATSTSDEPPAGTPASASADEQIEGSEASGGATTTSTTSSPAAAAGKAVLVIERVCGVRVEVDVEACYDQHVDGCPLRSRITFV